MRLGHVGVRQVVHTGAAAAPVGVGQRHELHAGERAQQPARGFAHALGVRQVAGVVVRDAKCARGITRRTHLVRRTGKVVVGKDLGHVARAVRQSVCGIGRGSVCHQVPALAKRRTASGGVGDHEVVSSIERTRILDGQRTRLTTQARVRLQCAAAGLGPRHRDSQAGDHHEPHALVVLVRDIAGMMQLVWNATCPLAVPAGWNTSESLSRSCGPLGGARSHALSERSRAGQPGCHLETLAREPRHERAGGGVASSSGGGGNWPKPQQVGGQRDASGVGQHALQTQWPNSRSGEALRQRRWDLPRVASSSRE